MAAPGAAVPADLAALVFERLPPAEQCVTVGRLAHAWRPWAASRVEPLAALLQQRWPVWRRRPQLPLWCVAEAWPQLSAAQRAEAGVRAAACGDVERLQWLRAQDPPCPWEEETCSEAARGGHLDVLRWLRAQDPPCPWEERTCHAASQDGHLDVLRWLRAQDPPCPWDEDTCSAAAVGGHLDVLRWLRAQDPPCPWNELTFYAAAERGPLDVLRWLRAQDPPCPWCAWTCGAAAGGGRLDVLRWLRAQDPPCPWEEDACHAAARGGHLDVLRWLRAQDPPCPWDKAACMTAAEEYADVAAWIGTQASAAWWRCSACSLWLLLGLPATRSRCQRLRPSCGHASRFWQLRVKNVFALCQITRAPTNALLQD
jgi:hypothetical protein